MFRQYLPKRYVTQAQLHYWIRYTHNGARCKDNGARYGYNCPLPARRKRAVSSPYPGPLHALLGPFSLSTRSLGSVPTPFPACRTCRLTVNGAGTARNAQKVANHRLASPPLRRAVSSRIWSHCQCAVARRRNRSCEHMGGASRYSTNGRRVARQGVGFYLRCKLT